MLQEKRREKKTSKKGLLWGKVEVEIKEAEKSEQWWFHFNIFTVTEKVDLKNVLEIKFITINIGMSHFNASNN